MLCEPMALPIDETVEPTALTIPPPPAATLPIALTFVVLPEPEPEPLDPSVPLVPAVLPADVPLPPPVAPPSELARAVPLPLFDPSPWLNVPDPPQAVRESSVLATVAANIVLIAPSFLGLRIVSPAFVVDWKCCGR
jgi:hypothetical protein